MPSAEPQAVLTPITEAAIFLVLVADPGSEDAIRDMLSDVSSLKRSVGFRIPEAELTCVTGIGSELWDRMFGLPRPASLHRFPGFAGARHTAPSTRGDLLFHIRAHHFDLCFELAQRLTTRLLSHATVADEVHGFRSFDDRDLLGFVDGTENPEGDAARDAVLIGPEDPAFAGSSYVVVQKYVHDLEAWDALTVEGQEQAFGRTKLSDIEFADEDKAPNSHLALNTIVDEDGTQHQIMRFNMPFGEVGKREFGTYFIGYARTPDVIEQMLTNMFVGKPPGTYDRILDFSRALTGNLYFVPSAAFLDDPPAFSAPSSSAATVDQGTPAAAVDRVAPDGPGAGSLGIGSLREASP